MHYAKNYGNPLSNTIKDTSTIMRNPLPELCREGLRMIVLVSLIVWDFLVSIFFRIVHSIPISQLNDFLHLFHIFCVWFAYAYMCICVG